tara:strand:- start:272 stop:916 length:645 start_codon:yes stop_codon:yes gene_type:complete
LISKHPGFEILLDYASGNLPQAPSVIIAVHSSMCTKCSDVLNSIDIAGAALMDNLYNENLETDSIENVLSQLEQIAENPEHPEKIFESKKYDLTIPTALQPFIPETLEWKSLSSGVKTVNLLTNDDYDLDIYKILPGYKIPKHTHKGSEFTLVFEGGYTDKDQHFGPGDFSLLDHETDHSPIADLNENCYCIVAMDNPIKLTGTFSRLLNLFTT